METVKMCAPSSGQQRYVSKTELLFCLTQLFFFFSVGTLKSDGVVQAEVVVRRLTQFNT